MPVTKIKVSFLTVRVEDSADIWGEADWTFKAGIDARSVGDPKKSFTAIGRSIILLPDSWSEVIDVSGKTKATDSFKITFSATCVHHLSGADRHEDLGAVSFVTKYPFHTSQTICLKSPVIKRGKFVTYLQCFSVQICIEVVEFKATTAPSGPKSVAASRQHDGSSTFTTVAGKQFVPRVEVCPVVPTPQAPTKLPQRPDISTLLGLAPGKDTPQSQPVTLWPLPNLNAICNPSLIPILDKKDPDLAKKAAKLAVTYIEPGDLDTSLLCWQVKSGPAEIVGPCEGPEILVVGTGAGATDELAEFEVRWGDAKGTLLATYRAWVGKIKQASYRINLINGTDVASSVVFTPQDYETQIQIARVIYWQAGIELVPDDDATPWDKASTKDASGAALPKGVFIVPVTDNTWTVNVNNFVPTIASRLNCHPGVLHAVFVRSTASGRAAATDIQGVDGKEFSQDGKPTSSWVVPSGVPPDKDPKKKLTLKTFASSNRLKKKAVGDDDYVKNRQKQDPGFKAADMGRIYAAVLPSDWSASGIDADAGVNLAHELGHVLGLHHRGSGDATNPPLSNDNIDSEDNAGNQRGHPWNENVMTYGYAQAGPPRALDLDLIQTPVIRKHPACH